MEPSQKSVLPQSARAFPFPEGNYFSPIIQKPITKITDEEQSNQYNTTNASTDNSQPILGGFEIPKTLEDAMHSFDLTKLEKTQALKLAKLG
jgi:hypothetical protein